MRPCNESSDDSMGRAFLAASWRPSHLSSNVMRWNSSQASSISRSPSTIRGLGAPRVRQILDHRFLSNPVAAARTRQATTMRAGGQRLSPRGGNTPAAACADYRSSTRQSDGTPSSRAVSSSSETRPRCVRGQRGHDHGSDAVRDRVSGEHQDRAITTRRGREPDLTALHRPSPTSPRRDPNRRSPTATVPPRRAVARPRSPRRSHWPAAADGGGARSRSKLRAIDPSRSAQRRASAASFVVHPEAEHRHTKQSSSYDAPVTPRRVPPPGRRRRVGFA